MTVFIEEFAALIDRYRMRKYLANIAESNTRKSDQLVRYADVRFATYWDATFQKVIVILMNTAV